MFLIDYVILGMGLENRHNCSRPDNIKANDHRRDLPNSVKTNNAGLELTADMLEEIYTNKDFPKSALPLKVSLADSGKSRADLWSFAAAVGVEWGIQRNNRACDGERVAEVDITQETICRYSKLCSFKERQI